MHILDVKRLLCPLPVIRLQNIVNRLTHGEIVEVICTDPGVKHDIPAWCRINGHAVLSITEDKFEIRIQVKIFQDLALSK